MTSARPILAGTSAENLQFAVFEGADAILQAKADWLDLCQRGGAPTAFQSYEVACACATAHLQREEMPRIVIARRDGQPIVIVPLVITKWIGARVARFLGDPLIQYCDVLAAPGAREEDIAAVWDAALNADVAAVALLRRVRDDAHTASYLKAHVAPVFGQETALVDLRQTSTLGARDARELRRLRRRLSEQGTVDVRFPSGAEAQLALQQALGLKRAWITQHGLASAVIGDGDWEAALADCVASGALRVAVLTVGGRMVAVELALCDRTSWYGFLSAFEPQFAKMGPGHVLTAACLSQARSEALSCFDQLPPAQAYKRQHATHILGVRDYALPLSAQGRLITVAARLFPGLKSAFTNLPLGVRQAVLACMPD